MDELVVKTEEIKQIQTHFRNVVEDLQESTFNEIVLSPDWANTAMSRGFDHFVEELTERRNERIKWLVGKDYALEIFQLEIASDGSFLEGMFEFLRGMMDEELR